MEVVFTKDNFHVFFQILKNLYESRLYKRQFSYNFFFLKKHVKIVFCKDNFHLIIIIIIFIFKKKSESYFS